MANRVFEDEEDSTKKIVGQITKGVIAGVFGIILLIAIFGSLYTITSGQEGVLLRFNKADVVAKEPGLHLKIPIVERVVKFDVRTQKFGVSATEKEGGSLESAASSDLQVVSVRIAINYHIATGKAPELFTKIGPAYESTVILPSIHESVKASTAKYKAEDLIKQRELVRADIENLLRQKLEPYNIIVEQVLITDFDFSKQYNDAIESKVTAEQLRMKAENDLERIMVEAQQIVAKANGDRDAAIAQATGEAQKVKLVQEQLSQSPQYIEYIRANKWNGAYPQFLMTSGSTGGSFLFNLPFTSNTTQ